MEQINSNEDKNIISFVNTSASDKKKYFLLGIQEIFRNWTALRMSIDRNSALIYNNIIECIDESEEIIEELEFNQELGKLYETICSIMIKEKAKNIREKSISTELKKFIDYYFFISLEDGSESEISCKIGKLFDEISQEKSTYYNNLFKYTTYIKFNIPFPCKINDDVKLDYSSESENESKEENDSLSDIEENDIDMNLEKSNINNKNENKIPELIEEFPEKMKLEEKFFTENDNDDGFIEVKSKNKKSKKK